MSKSGARIGSSDLDPDWRTGNVGRLMFAATDAFVRDKLRVMRASGTTGVSEAMMALILNLDREGTRLTVLAQRAGQTKQSMIELIDRAEAMRVVDRRPDPDDLRAKLVHFTPDGFGVLEALEHGIDAAERRFASVVGPPFVAQLRRELSWYAEVPELGRDRDPASHGEVSRREHNAGRLLSLAARRFARDLLGAVHQHGHRDVTEVLLALFRHLDLGGTRLTDLAARARVTKPSMRALVDEAEALRLVERRPDPTDRRAKIVLFTSAGLALLEEVRRGVSVAEARFDERAGERFVRTLKARLTVYLAADASGLPGASGLQAISSAVLPSTGCSDASTTANSSG